MFRNPCDVQRHIDSIHEKVINFVCPICNKGFTRKDRFVEHTELHKRKAQFRPKRIFVENATVHLESDEEDPVENGEFPCDSCNQSYSSLKGVTTHKMRLHETLNKFQCEECPETFFLRNDLNTHEEDIHGKIKLPEIFKCEECGEEFLDITVLYKHYSINHPKTTFKCSNCNLEFTKLSVYKIHMRRFKDLGRCFNSREDPERIFSCNICEKAYKTTGKFLSLVNFNQVPFLIFVSL